MLTISAKDFFEIWQQVCKARKEQLLAVWTSCPNYTAAIFDGKNAVIQGVAENLELAVYGNYYALDAVFVQKDFDRVHCAPQTQNWFHNIRVAFEHENFFRSGLFQEVSHLLITRADLRVLVSYPDNECDLVAELTNLALIVSSSTLASSDPAFLFIVGDRINSNTDIRWRAFTYQHKQLLPLPA